LAKMLVFSEDWISNYILNHKDMCVNSVTFSTLSALMGEAFPSKLWYAPTCR